MNYYVIIRDLIGEVNPGKAVIISEKSYLSLRFNRIFFEYSIGPFNQYEYGKALKCCERYNEV